MPEWECSDGYTNPFCGPINAVWGTIEFLSDPPGWILKHLTVAAMEVSSWWITAPEPVIGVFPNSSETVHSMSGKLGVVTFMIMIGSFFTAGIKLVRGRRGEPAARLLQSLVALVVVSITAITLTNALVQASDIFSNWFMVKSLAGENPEATIDDAYLKLGNEINQMNFFLGVAVDIILLFSGLSLYGYMLLRVPIIVGIVIISPSVAAATATELGQMWGRKTTALWVGVIGMEPATAVCTPLALELSVTSPNSGDSAAHPFAGAFLILVTVAAGPSIVMVLFPMAAAGGSTGGNMSLIAAGTAAGAKVVAGGAKVAGGAVAGGTRAVWRRGRSSPAGGQGAAATGSAQSAGRAPSGPAGRSGSSGRSGRSGPGRSTPQDTRAPAPTSTSRSGHGSSSSHAQPQRGAHSSPQTPPGGAGHPRSTPRPSASSPSTPPTAARPVQPPTPQPSTTEGTRAPSPPRPASAGESPRGADTIDPKT